MTYRNEEQFKIKIFNNEKRKQFICLNLVLVPDPLGTPNVSFGSFLIFRKLEQNVQQQVFLAGCQIGDVF